MKQDINTIIDEIVRNQFKDAHIDKVHVHRELDADGDEVLRVIIVYEAKHGLNAAKATGLVRHMRSRLADDGNFVFPVVAFRSRADAKRVKPEAA